MKPNPNRELELQSRAAKLYDMLAQDIGKVAGHETRLACVEVALERLTAEAFTQANLIRVHTAQTHQNIDPDIVIQGFTDIGLRIQKLDDLLQGLASHVEDLERRTRGGASEEPAPAPRTCGTCGNMSRGRIIGGQGIGVCAKGDAKGLPVTELEVACGEWEAKP